MSRTEYQVKLKDTGHLTIEELVRRGGELIGNISQEDIYIRGTDEGNHRLRDENGLLTISYEITKEQRTLTDQANCDCVQGKTFFKRKLREKVLTRREFDRRLKLSQAVNVLRIFKERTTVYFRDAVVIFDEVEYLGNFIKVRCENKERLCEIIQELGLHQHDFIIPSYRKMMEDRHLPIWLKKIQAFHRKTGELTFGIASGILTAVGLMVGMNSSTSMKIAVMASVAVISCADSLSDAFGIFLSKIAERGTSKMEALRYAFGTFAGKFLFPLTFLIPLIVFDSLTTGVIVNIIWGGFSLTLLTIEQQLVAEEPIWKGLIQNLGLATTIIVLSSLIGNFINSIAL